MYNACAPHVATELTAEAEALVAQHIASYTHPQATHNEQAIRRSSESISSDSIRRPAFLRDSEKIIHTPAYNRLAGKTQVFSFRDNDDLTRRGLHVQLVSRVARDIGRSLGLNLDLIEAIALGHDIGHTPFGHAGERFLNDVYHKRTGRWFMHNVQSVRVLDVLYGRNLTLQTLDGIICHNGEFEQQKFRCSDLNNFADFDAMVESCWANGYEQVKMLAPLTMEGCVVRISDIIAYVGKDRQDAIAAGLLDPDAFDDGLGGAYNSWALSAFTTDIIENSLGKDHIEMSKEAFEELRRAKRENYQKIYLAAEVNGSCTETTQELFGLIYEHEMELVKSGNENTAIYKHHIQPLQDALAYYGKTYDFEDDLDLCVVDFISSMTDDYFIDLATQLYGASQVPVPKRGYFDHVEPHLI